MIISLLFVWSGFVRGGLGFGGAALAMPLMLLVVNDPVLWLPVISFHLLIFSAITLYGRLKWVDWAFLKKALIVLLIPKLIGVFGLLSLPNSVLVTVIYGITLVYGLTYIVDFQFRSGGKWLDAILLIIGGYASGTSLIGAPLISAVFARHVEIAKLRDTLFFLWMIMVMIKMSTFVAFNVDLQLKYGLLFLPLVGLGHWLGLKVHRYLINDQGRRYKRVIGVLLVLICVYGLWANLSSQ